MFGFSHSPSLTPYIFLRVYTCIHSTAGLRRSGSRRVVRCILAALGKRSKKRRERPSSFCGECSSREKGEATARSFRPKADRPQSCLIMHHSRSIETKIKPSSARGLSDAHGNGGTKRSACMHSCELHDAFVAFHGIMLREVDHRQGFENGWLSIR